MLSGQDDVELARRICAGDQDAFERLYESFFPRVYAAALRHAADAATAETMTAATLEHVIQKLSQYRGEAPLAAFVLMKLQEVLAATPRAALPSPAVPAARG